jgi:hypothetical protein
MMPRTLPASFRSLFAVYKEPCADLQKQGIACCLFSTFSSILILKKVECPELREWILRKRDAGEARREV